MRNSVFGGKGRKASKTKAYIFAVAALVLGVLIFMLAVGNPFGGQKHPEEKNGDYRVVAYVTPWNWSGLPDASKLTHVIYSFAEIDTETHLMQVPQDKYLKQLVDLKQTNPELKVMLSLGGGGGDGFSQAAETDEARKIFAGECLRLVNEYRLDGIDIDWESPVNGNWGSIRAIPEDKENCTALLKEIRSVVGKDVLISFAAASTKSYSTWVELGKLNEYVDFFNLMSYCYSVGAPGYHDANLLPSAKAAMGGISVDYGVNLLKTNGVDPKKIVIGIPFFAYAGNKAINQTGLQNYIESGDYVELWDEEANAPYLAKQGSKKISVTFDNPRSVALKAAYVKENKLGGIMCWEYGQDDEKRTMSNAVWNGLNSPAEE